MTRWTADQLAEYMASMAPYMPQGSTLPEGEDSGPESVLSRKIVKYCSEHAFPCLCFPQTKDVRKFLPSGWTD